MSRRSRATQELDDEPRCIRVGLLHGEIDDPPVEHARRAHLCAREPRQEGRPSPCGRVEEPRHRPRGHRLRPTGDPISASCSCRAREPTRRRSWSGVLPHARADRRARRVPVSRRPRRVRPRPPRRPCKARPSCRLESDGLPRGVGEQPQDRRRHVERLVGEADERLAEDHVGLVERPGVAPAVRVSTRWSGVKSSLRPLARMSRTTSRRPRATGAEVRPHAAPPAAAEARDGVLGGDVFDGEPVAVRGQNRCSSATHLDAEPDPDGET